MCDQVEIEDFFEKKLNILDDKELFSDFQYQFVNDINSGSYASGQVQFNLTNMGDKFTILRDSYLEIPLSVSSSVVGTPYTAATKIAIKNSLLSLISGLQITTTDGSVIVNEQTGATPIIQNLKLLLDSNIDWVNSLAQTIHYEGKDTLTSFTYNGNTPIDGIDPDITQGIATTDYTTNYALANRIAIFTIQTAAAGNFGTVNGVANAFPFLALIPLRLLHSVFDQFSFPMVNYPMLMTFNIAGVAGSQYQPFTYATAVANAGINVGAAGAVGATVAINAVTAPATVPLVNVSPGVTERGYAPGACRLKMKTVKFHSETAKKIKAHFDKGFTKTIQYTVTDYYKPIASFNLAAGATTGVNQLITNSAIRPVRLWCLPVPQVGTTPGILSPANTFPGSIGPGYLTQCNIQVNNENYYNNNLQSQYDFYKIIETQQVGAGESSTSGAQISYADWLCGLNPYVFDLSRVRQLDVNNPVSLFISATMNTTVTQNFDIIFLVERLMTLTMDVKTSSITSVVKAGTYN
jgi:hypothetical protein